MKKYLNLFDFSQKVNYRTEVLSGLTVALALVPEAIAFALIPGFARKTLGSFFRVWLDFQLVREKQAKEPFSIGALPLSLIVQIISIDRSSPLKGKRLGHRF